MFPLTEGMCHTGFLESRAQNTFRGYLGILCNIHTYFFSQTTNLFRISLIEDLLEFLTIKVVVGQSWNHFLPKALQGDDL